MACFAPNQYRVELSPEQCSSLEEICRNGHAPAKKVRHAQVLLWSDRRSGQGHRTAEEIAGLLGIHVNTVARIRKQFVLEGEKPALNRKPRTSPPTPPILDGQGEAHLVAICCSPAPEGRTSWTLELLAQELVKRRVVTRISGETVRRVLKKRVKAVAEKVLVHPGARSRSVRCADGRGARRLRGRSSCGRAAGLHG